jgi:hypothetical protein
MTVVLSGHGGFELDTKPPWATVPPGTTINFYTENMKALFDDAGGAIETLSAAFQSATPSQVVSAGQSCPNYTLYPPDGLDIQDSPDDVYQHIVSTPVTLTQLIADGIVTGEVHWAACRVVELAPAGGELLGVNAGQNDFGYEGGAVDVEIDDDAEEVDTADGWLRKFWRRDEATRMQMFTDLPSGYKRLYADYSPDLGTWARQNGFIV